MRPTLPELPAAQGQSARKPLPKQLAGIDNLVVIGLNYHNTPLEIRERFVIPDYCLGHALGALKHMPAIAEAVILSTCNRTEVYAVVKDMQAGMADIESFFQSTQRIADHGALKPNFKLLRDDVSLHLFRVASGLDSMILGEGQIMSQVKAAHRTALDLGACGPILDQLFKLALSCGKRVRSETSMSRRAVSVSSAAVELARELEGNLRDKTTLIVGAGKMARICSKHVLSESGSGPVVMINRTPEKLAQFAESKLPNNQRLQANMHFDDRHQLAAAADVVIVSTSAPAFLLTPAEFKKVHGGKPVTIIDISVPRNVDPEIGNLPGVKLYSADDLTQIVDKNRAERLRLVEEAEGIVFDTLSEFQDYEKALVVSPTITDLRKKVESIRRQHMQRSGAQVKAPEMMDQEVDLVTRAIINEILHDPTVQLKSSKNWKHLIAQAKAVRTLFNLDQENDQGIQEIKSVAEPVGSCRPTCTASNSANPASN